MQRRGTKPLHDPAATVQHDSTVLNHQLERPKRTEADLIRARVRAKILRRVQELEAELHDDELKQEIYDSSASTDTSLERLTSTSLARGNTAKHEVVKVATQILGRCLNNQSTDKDHTLELQLVHRMLTKECELLSIQTQMENSQLKQA